jgi:pimeloyl-ACP methyl ester carboxylesterase
LACLITFCAASSEAQVVRDDRFFDSNGVKIRYIEQGSGDAVVLVHGRGGSAESWMTASLFSTLAADYRVIALDCRGHGKSGKPHDPQQYGQELSLDIVRLLDHLRIRRAHIVGYSLGAHIASHLLTIRPDRFISVTLGGSAGRFQWTAKDDAMFEQQAAEVEKLGFSPSARQLTTGVRQTADEIKTRSTAILADANQDRFAMAALIRSFRELVITPAQVAAVNVPALGMAGSEDPYLIDLQALKKIRPALQLVVIDGATHDGASGANRRPEFIAALRAFLGLHRQSPLQ